MRSPGLRPWHRQIRDRARAGDLQALVPVLPFLEGERRFFPASGDIQAELQTAGPYDVGQPVVFNHGALACVRALVALLQPGGFVLVNDYGVTRAGTSAELGPVQWFGPAAATGLNFPLLERCCGAVACTPEGDDVWPSTRGCWCVTRRRRPVRSSPTGSPWPRGGESTR